MTKTNLIGIPGQGKANAKTRQAQMKKAQEAENKKRAENYYVGMRLEYAQKYPLETAKKLYEFVMNESEYPEVSYYHQAVMVWMDKQEDKNIKEVNEKEVLVIYNFLKNEE